MKKLLTLALLITSLSSFAYEHSTCEYKVVGFNSIEEVEELFDRVDQGDFKKLLNKKKLNAAVVGDIGKNYVLLKINVINRNLDLTFDAGSFKAIASIRTRKPHKEIKNFIKRLPKCRKRRNARY